MRVFGQIGALPSADFFLGSGKTRIVASIGRNMLRPASRTIVLANREPYTYPGMVTSIAFVVVCKFDYVSIIAMIGRNMPRAARRAVVIAHGRPYIRPFAATTVAFVMIYKMIYGFAHGVSPT